MEGNGNIDMLTSAYKDLTKRIVLPSMGLATIAFYVALFRSTPEVIAAIAFGVLGAIANAVVTTKPESRRGVAHDHR